MMNVFVCGLLIAILLFVVVKAPLNLFLLTGTVIGRNGQIVSLVSNELADNGQILCSVTIQNNKFRLSCQVFKDVQAYLVFGEGTNKTKYPVTLSRGHFSFCETEATHLFKTT